jgi:hypothetical protein
MKPLQYFNLAAVLQTGSSTHLYQGGQYIHQGLCQTGGQGADLPRIKHLHHR